MRHSFWVITERKNREMWVGRVSKRSSEEEERQGGEDHHREFWGRLDFIFLTLGHSLFHPSLSEIIQHIKTVFL